MTEPAAETEDLPEHIQRLGQALAALGVEVMTLSELDGLLAAVIACPEPIPPEEWLPLVWTGEDVDEADLLGRPEVPEAVAHILLRQEEIARQLAQGEGAFLPILDEDASGEILWQMWVIGFETGMSLRPEAWEALHARGGDPAEALTLLITLAMLVEDEAAATAELGAEDVEQLKSDASEIVAECVEVLAWAKPRQPVRVDKIGRNDPCGCGSGKKFKKCCGAA